MPAGGAAPRLPRDNFAWRRQIPVLGEFHRIIAPDLRGYGETDKRTMARDLAELLDALGIDRIALLGYDRGSPCYEPGSEAVLIMAPTLGCRRKG
ncbi:alpha/beta fold hydrolase [Sphingomonas sp. NFR15]|uniref:alpha/beta fold hydrolase n=1 Tax=Sphingomonas sp. NFR15 TaxID=1566282 RepID=UPI000883FB2F|nr:alpha/beta fold hydrolase [Sphingomonas sp. NFR15]SDA35714.1 alpha/beta hydrolase fold [Sphingomonas sp. NFR15]